MATDRAAQGPTYPVLVRVSKLCAGLEKKLQKYFQSPRKSGGGECMVKAGPTEGTFWVEFLEKEAKERVIAKRDHTVEISDTSSVNVFLETNENSEEKNTLGINQLSSQTQSLPKEFLDEKEHPEERGASNSSIQKVFLRVEAHLNFSLAKEQREKIINLCPNLNIEEGHDGADKVIGDYQDIEKIYQFLSEWILGNDQKEDIPHSASAREIKETMPNDLDSPFLHSNSKDRTEESDLISVPSHLYDYFKYFFAETLERIEKEHKVDIKKTFTYPTGNVCLDFRTNKPADRKAAKEAFTTVFQREIQNVTSNDVHFTDDKLALEIQTTLTNMFKNLYIKAEGKVLTLRGNTKDILEAKQLIETNFSHKQPVKIMVSENMMRNGIEVDTTHLRLLLQEITEIEKKYDTTMELVNKPLTGKTLIVFKPKDKGLDLSAHAYEYFIDVFQMISPQIVKEVVILKPLNEERKGWSEKTIFEDFETKHPHVNLEWNEQKPILTGLPKYLSEALKYFKRYFYIESPVQQRPALSLEGNLNEGLKSPLDKNYDDFKMALPPSKGLPTYGDLEKEKEEEKEKCAICMEIIQHKEILPKCKHEFCGPCIKEAMKHKPLCPLCQTSYGIVKGNQPDGTMSVIRRFYSLPGYSLCDTIEIRYDMIGGIQTEDHPNPGKYYGGTSRLAYLPNNEEGQHILNLLKRAFEQKLIFTVGQSRTLGTNDVITWNDIHHKTQIHGGPENFGYPDPNYLKRVKLELKAKGIE
ncbi:E3 ubiquitin-protein ligase DTX3L [Dromiciops gliroides]|uniref:E3 ubiquitin-protein ligase DTX3L n=1 Tax=Dromiciops gliroides TaxID=33562 RepID=UPI001CC33FDB|nr:E3 ubiquitin-protein ligase DTX3L [Dromiciops gliroides]